MRWERQAVVRGLVVVVGVTIGLMLIALSGCQFKIDQSEEIQDDRIDNIRRR